MQKLPSLSDSGVCCGSGCYICSIGVKIPKLAFRHASCKIVRLVQQVFDKNDFVDVVSFVFLLVLTVARESEWSIKVGLDVICLFEIAGCSEHLFRIYSWKNSRLIF